MNRSTRKERPFHNIEKILVRTSQALTVLAGLYLLEPPQIADAQDPNCRASITRDAKDILIDPRLFNISPRKDLLIILDNKDLFVVLNEANGNTPARIVTVKPNRQTTTKLSESDHTALVEQYYATCGINIQPDPTVARFRAQSKSPDYASIVTTTGALVAIGAVIALISSRISRKKLKPPQMDPMERRRQDLADARWAERCARRDTIKASQQLAADAASTAAETQGFLTILRQHPSFSGIDTQGKLEEALIRNPNKVLEVQQLLREFND
jgi:hypothetical protein